MAEARFEQYHVPQQSRRDKLRVNQLPLHGILDPTDFITCAGSGPRYNNRSSGESNKDVSVSEFMGYVAGNGMNMIMTPSPANCLYADPPINPTQIQDISCSTPFLYNPFHGGGGGGGGDMMVYRPEQVCSDQTPNSNSNSGHGQGLSLSLNLQRYDSGMCVFPGSGPGDGGSTSGEMVSRSSVQPIGPFTGYASTLKGSRFLKPAQLLLGELCDVGRDFYVEKFNVGNDPILLDPVPSLECFSGDDEDDSKKKSRLISMLHEVHRRYKQYYQQMQLVIASFESVAGVRNAAPFACLALKSMSKNFRCLKIAITEQLQLVIEPRGHVASTGQESTPGSDTPRSGMHYPCPPQITGYTDQPVWRPQRGLPERAVTVLRSWLFDHFLHPYPTDTDKLMLAKQTGLSRNQVSNWFINARVRLWKPMVEEIHMLETKQGEKQKDDQIAGNNNGHGQGQNGHFSTPPGVLTAPENVASTPNKRSREFRQKRSRDESNMFPSGNDQIHQNVMNNVSYENSFHPGSGGFGMSKAVGNGGVSLTLGLYQNNNLGLGLPEPYPMNAARRFGLDGSNAGGFSGSLIHQNRHAFGREIVGGQLLHDFVG